MTSERKQIDNLIDLTSRLTSIINQEISLLRAMRSSEIGPLQDEKTELATAYAGAFQAVRKRPSAVRDADPSVREALKQATAALKIALDENVLAVHAAKDVNERLIRAISDAVSQTRAAAPVYTATGCSAPAAAAANSTSLAIDQRI